jgi:transcriptional regulator
MYRPSHFEVQDRAELIDVIRRHPLAQVVTAGADGIVANPIPFTVVAGEGDRLLLRAHLARANPQWKAMAAGSETLLIFSAAEHYVTPSWYETKRATGKVVPTWNYVVVQARGPVTVDDSPEWLWEQVERITLEQEAGVGSDWKVTDAPEAYMAAMMRGIVGIEMQVTSLAGKFKLSQNRPEADRVGIVAGLGGLDRPDAARMAGLVRRHGAAG